MAESSLPCVAHYRCRVIAKLKPHKVNARFATGVYVSAQWS